MKIPLCAGLFICAVLLFAGPQAGFAYQNVTNTPDGGCLQCHTFAGGTGANHATHTDADISCASCHTGGTPGKNVLSSTCSVCHPSGDPGACQIINTVSSHPKTGANSCLTCHAACAGTDNDTGACQDWVGTWQFTYGSQGNTTVCIDNSTLDNETLALCENDAEPNCVCIDNVTDQQLCYDPSTFEQCDNQTQPGCQCFDNPFYRPPSVTPGTYEVVINTAQENFTAGQIEFLCYATGTRTSDSEQIFIGQPSADALGQLPQNIRNLIDNGTYLVYEGSLDNITLTFAQIPENSFTGTSFTASTDFNFIGLTSGTKQDDNITTQCELSIFPRTFSRLRAFIFTPLQAFVISADRQTSTIDFVRPIDIDWGTDAINDIVKLRIGPRIIIGFILVRPFQLQAGDYDVTVRYGDNGTACGPIQVL